MVLSNQTDVNMNKILLYFAFVVISLTAVACSSSKSELERDYASYVNPFIGTGGHGHTHPAAIVPHGMIQPGPDTRINGWDSSSGYYYNDSTINGFAHTRLSGTGCADFGDFLIMPTVGDKDIRFLGAESQSRSYASTYSHDKEKAEPGYYSVFLDRYGINAEMTATERAAIHRYRFPKSDKAGFILDLDYNIQPQTNLEMDVKVINDSTIAAYKRSAYWAYNQHIYMYAVFSKPFQYTIYSDTVKAGKDKIAQKKLLLDFNTEDNEEVYVKMGISSVDSAGAKKNLLSEIKGWDFDKVRSEAREKWNNELSKIDVKSSDEDWKIIFYTSMYHANISPNIFTDVDGRYRGMDLKIHSTDPNDPVYTIFSLWDTFRALNPLMSIIEPEMNEAYIRSLLKKGEEGGIVPKWDCAANYTGCMIGYHFVSLVADAYTKGYKNFDMNKAMKAALRAAEYDTTGITPAAPKWIYPYIMPKARYYKEKMEYIPSELENESVAKGLEYAYNDWCISIMADAVGDKANKEKYAGYAKAYREYFDPETGFMRGKKSNGEWRTPFNPRSSNHRNDDYCEGTAWQWTWFVPHDIAGLVNLMGGEDKFAAKLDSLFSVSSKLEGEETSADISGLIGQYAHGNEPSHHITHLYNYVNRPWKTQELVDSVLQNLYSNAPDGLSGNEDCGQMSAWYILNSMGFYQVAPGRPVYSIGRPLFDEAVIHQPSGKDFVIKTINNSKKNRYIKRINLNGKIISTPFFTHGDIVNGGTLEIEMTDIPVKEVK